MGPEGGGMKSPGSTLWFSWRLKTAFTQGFTTKMRNGHLYGCKGLDRWVLNYGAPRWSKSVLFFSQIQISRKTLLKLKLKNQIFFVKNLMFFFGVPDPYRKRCFFSHIHYFISAVKHCAKNFSKFF